MGNSRFKIQDDSPGDLDNLLVRVSVALELYLPSKNVQWKFGKHDH